MSEKTRTRTPYTAEEKTEIILAVMNRKTTIQKIAKEKNIAPTLVSLWKKQAEDAILEARTAKTRATRLESALKNAKSRVAALESSVRDLAAVMGCKLVKAVRPRRKKD